MQASQAQTQVKWIPIEQLFLDRDVPQVPAYGRSLEAAGHVMPLRVKAEADGRYRIEGGAKTFAQMWAAHLEDTTKYSQVLCLVEDPGLDEQGLAMRSLAEALCRKHNDPHEADLVWLLLSTPGPDGKPLTQAQVATIGGVSQATVSQLVRLRELHPLLLDKLGKGLLVRSAAFTCLRLSTAGQDYLTKVAGRVTLAMAQALLRQEQAGVLAGLPDAVADEELQPIAPALDSPKARSAEDSYLLSPEQLATLESGAEVAVVLQGRTLRLRANQTAETRQAASGRVGYYSYA